MLVVLEISSIKTSRSSASRVPAKEESRVIVKSALSTGDTTIGSSTLIVAGAVVIVRLRLETDYELMVTVPVTEKAVSEND